MAKCQRWIRVASILETCRFHANFGGSSSGCGIICRMYTVNILYASHKISTPGFQKQNPKNNHFFMICIFYSTHIVHQCVYFATSFNLPWVIHLSRLHGSSFALPFCSRDGNIPLTRIQVSSHSLLIPIK